MRERRNKTDLLNEQTIEMKRNQIKEVILLKIALCFSNLLKSSEGDVALK